MNYRQSLLTAAVLGALAATQPATAVEAVKKGYEGYVTSATGDLAKDSDGHCIRNSTWKPAMAIEQCDPDLIAKAPEPEPEPIAMEVEPVTKPIPVAAEIETKPQYKLVDLRADTLFDFDKATLRQEGKAELDTLASYLKNSDGNERIRVVGHTDAIGSSSYNMDLSARRAQSVKDYLTQQHGIDSSVIMTEAMGESNPVASNKTAEGRQQNRRVEIYSSAKVAADQATTIPASSRIEIRERDAQGNADMNLEGDATAVPASTRIEVEGDVDRDGATDAELQMKMKMDSHDSRGDHMK